MEKKVLYFPYIRVPECSWFTRTLLYWDRVGAIVPYDFIHKPERLGEHMRSLVEHQLVEQIIPGMYIYEIPRFHDAFAEYIDALGSDIETRRDRFRRGQSMPIHIEKMDSVSDMLQRHRLARPGRRPWYNVESETADDFMSYLAACVKFLQKTVLTRHDFGF